MFIVGLILGVIVVIFVLQNVIPVSVVFLGWHFNGSLALILLLAILLGMVISWLLSLPDMLKLSDLMSHNKRLQKDLEIHRQKLTETEEKLAPHEQADVTRINLPLQR